MQDDSQKEVCSGERRHNPMYVHCTMEGQIESLVIGIKEINLKLDDWTKKMYVGNGQPSFNARIIALEAEASELKDSISKAHNVLITCVGVLLISIISYILLHVFKVTT